MKLNPRSKIGLFFCLGALLSQAKTAVVSQAADPADPVERTLSAVHTAPVLIVREINAQPLRFNSVIQRSAFKKAIPGRALNSHPFVSLEPEVRVLKVTPVSKLSSGQIGGFNSLSPLLNLFRNFGIKERFARGDFKLQIAKRTAKWTLTNPSAATPGRTPGRTTR